MPRRPARISGQPRCHCDGGGARVLPLSLRRSQPRSLSSSLFCGSAICRTHFCAAILTRGDKQYSSHTPFTFFHTSTSCSVFGGSSSSLLSSRAAVSARGGGGDASGGGGAAAVADESCRRRVLTYQRRRREGTSPALMRSRSSRESGSPDERSDFSIAHVGTAGGRPVWRRQRQRR
ncbi:hypothetical protein AB1Y20_020801 [Prymnesium parvum]|uniref:Uncharacterized protein n=1 Tax=Prymnesium parvum TaxID=97485 RepID=A0AB34JVN5_PRYPA